MTPGGLRCPNTPTLPLLPLSAIPSTWTSASETLPASPTTIALSPHTSSISLLLTLVKKKRQDAAHTDEVRKGLLVPFAVESTGRLGNAAVDYTHHMTLYIPELQERGIPPPSDILQFKMATALTRIQARHACQFYQRLRGSVTAPEDESENEAEDY